jgi:hypothetical protein
VARTFAHRRSTSASGTAPDPASRRSSWPLCEGVACQPLPDMLTTLREADALHLEEMQYSSSCNNTSSRFFFPQVAGKGWVIVCDG